MTSLNTRGSIWTTAKIFSLHSFERGSQPRVELLRGHAREVQNTHYMKAKRNENRRGSMKDPPVFVFTRKAERYMLDGSFNSQNSHSDCASKNDNSGHFRKIPSPRCFLFIVDFHVFSLTVLFLVFWTPRYVVELLVDKCSNAIAG